MRFTKEVKLEFWGENNKYEKHIDNLLFTNQIHGKFSIGNSSTDWWNLKIIDSR